mmetsp:Transcript_23318/g.66372  ORF Transcript_23318/g.66372 Transcript_23318/m.66372 type:complete len:891 (-) Transcript_23318:139-2811(-)
MLKRQRDDKAAQHGGEKEDVCRGSVEMMRNPVVLAIFRGVIERPLMVIVAWHVLLFVSMGIASQYDSLKHKPLRWHSFNNDLRSVQDALTFDFGLGGSNYTFDSVIIWSESGRDLRGNPDLMEAISAVEAALGSVKSSPTTACTRKALEQMVWQGYNSFMPPDLAKQFLAADGSATVVLISHACNLPAIKRRLASIETKFKGLRVALGSPNAVVQSSVDAASTQVAWHMIICGPIMWVLLWWNTGSMFRAGTAFVCLLCSMFGTRAITVIIKWCWQDLNFSAPDEVVITFVQLALCLDYCLFFWTRFSQERLSRPEPRFYKQAVMTTLQTSGAVITVSVCVLIIGSLAMCFYPDQNTLGCLANNIQMIIGINLLGTYSLVVPASLAVQFPSLFDTGGRSRWSHHAWRSKRLDSVMNGASEFYHSLIARMSIFVTTQPWMVVIPIIVYACLCPLILELRQFRPNFDLFAASASPKVPEYEAFRMLEAKFNVGRLEPVMVLLEAAPLGPAPVALHRDALAMLQTRLELQCPDCGALPDAGAERAGSEAVSRLMQGGGGAGLVSLSGPFRLMACRYIENVLRGTRGSEYEIRPENVQSVWWNGTSCAEEPHAREPGGQSLVAAGGTKQVLRLFPAVHETSLGSRAMTQFFWDKIEPESRGTFDFQGQRYEFRARHFSDMANIMLMQGRFADRAPWILVVLVLLICMVVGLLFSSLGLGLKMIITVVLPIVAEFGLMVGIYQCGWMEWAGIPQTNGVVWTHVYTTVGLLLGLAIDYDIFLFARVYERRMEGFDNVSAVRLAVNETASVITVAGTVMCVSFFFVSLSGIYVISQLGVLYLFGVALDTYVVRTILAPSILCLSETMNYWPGKVPPVTKTWHGDVGKFSFGTFSFTS